jgi:hypothetical protein
MKKYTVKANGRHIPILGSFVDVKNAILSDAQVALIKDAGCTVVEEKTIEVILVKNENLLQTKVEERPAIVKLKVEPRQKSFPIEAKIDDQPLQPTIDEKEVREVSGDSKKVIAKLLEDITTKADAVEFAKERDIELPSNCKLKEMKAVILSHY